MATLAPMNTAREPCRSHCGALRRWVRRKSTSRLRNQAHAPQSAAAARTLRLRATSLSLLSEKVSQPACHYIHTLRSAGSMAAFRAGSQGDPEQHRHSTPEASEKLWQRPPCAVFRTKFEAPTAALQAFTAHRESRLYLASGDHLAD